MLVGCEAAAMVIFDLRRLNTALQRRKRTHYRALHAEVLLACVLDFYIAALEMREKLKLDASSVFEAAASLPSPHRVPAISPKFAPRT